VSVLWRFSYLNPIISKHWGYKHTIPSVGLIGWLVIHYLGRVYEYTLSHLHGFQMLLVLTSWALICIEPPLSLFHSLLSIHAVYPIHPISWTCGPRASHVLLFNTYTASYNPTRLITKAKQRCQPPSPRLEHHGTNILFYYSKTPLDEVRNKWADRRQK